MSRHRQSAAATGESSKPSSSRRSIHCCRSGLTPWFSSQWAGYSESPRAIIIPFRYLLNDIWFASAENMCHIKRKLDQEFTKKNLAVLDRPLEKDA